MCRRNLTVELSINSYYEVELGGADFADEDWIVYAKYNKLSRSRAVTSRLVPRTVLEHSWGKVFNQRATSYDQGTVQIQRARPSFNVHPFRTSSIISRRSPPDQQRHSRSREDLYTYTSAPRFQPYYLPPPQTRHLYGFHYIRIPYTQPPLDAPSLSLCDRTRCTVC